MPLPLDHLRHAGAAIGAIGLVAFGLTIGPVVAQDAGTGDAAGAKTTGQGDKIAPGTGSGVGGTPIVGSGANGNVVQGTGGSGGATATSDPKASEPQLKQ